MKGQRKNKREREGPKRGATGEIKNVLSTSRGRRGWKKLLGQKRGGNNGK